MASSLAKRYHSCCNIAQPNVARPSGTGLGTVGRNLLRTRLRPRHPAELPLAELEHALDQQGECRRWYGSREQGHVVVQRKTRSDALAVAARADEGRDGRGADVDDRRGLDTGE